MVASHLIWMLRTRDMRERAKASGQTFDEADECVQWQAKGYDLGRWFSRNKASSTHDLESRREGTETLIVPPPPVVTKSAPIAVV
jgi:hypothetical protein